MDTPPPARAEREPGRAPDDDEPPPFLGRWSVLYAAVVAELLLIIALCYALTLHGR
jgi:hypothetical protein